MKKRVLPRKSLLNKNTQQTTYMKKILLPLMLALMVVTSSAQSRFNLLGEGEKAPSDFRKLSGVTVPQLRVGFETHSVATIVKQEGKVSALRGNLATVGTNKNYTRQSSMVEASSILNSGMEKSDFQQLTNDFQLILEDELKKAGIKLTTNTELQSVKEYAPIKENFSKKTDKVESKQEDADLSEDRIYYIPDNSLMIYNGTGVGHGVGTIVKLQKLVQKTDAVMLLHNLDVDFSFIKLEADVQGGWNYSGSSTIKTTNASVQVFPIMNIPDLKLVTIGSNGSISTVPITLKSTYLSQKTYEAKMYQDKKKSESLFTQMFSLKRKRDIEFDPMIIELSKEDYIRAAKDMFRQYASDLAKAIDYSQKNKK